MPLHLRLCKHYVCKNFTRCARFFYPPYLKKNIIFFNLLRLKEPAQSTQSVPIRFLPFHSTLRNFVTLCFFVFVSLIHTALLHFIAFVYSFASLIICCSLSLQKLRFCSLHFVQIHLFFATNTANRKIYSVKKLY